MIERVPKVEIEPPEEPESDTAILARSGDRADPVKLEVGDGMWLSHESIAAGMCVFVFEFCLSLTDNEGQIKWKFDLKDTGFEMRYCPYEERCRYSAPYLYLLTCEKRTTRMENKIAVYNPTQFHLLTLDLATGRIVQDIQITKTPVDVCRFEDIDENGVLVSDSERTVHYFEKSSKSRTT